jgi:hypothetical protein
MKRIIARLLLIVALVLALAVAAFAQRVYVTRTGD